MNKSVFKDMDEDAHTSILRSGFKLKIQMSIGSEIDDL